MSCIATLSEQLRSYRSELTEAEAPAALEVFCDLNPSNVPWRVYDD